jgi:hypothetical protein
MISAEIHNPNNAPPKPRQTRVLRLVGVAPSSWHRPPRDPAERKRPGPARRALPDEVVQGVVAMATANPWYGYKRIAVMCRRAGQKVTNRLVYRVMKDHDLLHKRRTRRAEVYQAARLFELLPQGPNDMWQMDVTYIHIPGCGWWYAVTVIDYYSRYLLTCHLTSSYSAAETAYALKLAREEAERIFGAGSERNDDDADDGVRQDHERHGQRRGAGHEQLHDRRKQDEHGQVVDRHLHQRVRRVAARQIAPHENHRCAWSGRQDDRAGDVLVG